MPSADFARYSISANNSGSIPDALVCNPLCVGLCLADQRRQSFAQIGSGCLVEAVIDLTRIDQVVALAAGEIDDPRMPLRAAP